MGLPAFINKDIDSWLASFKFSISIPIRFSETDAFGHVNNTSYFIYFEQARLDYLKHLNILNFLIQSQTENIVVTANLECHYISQLHFEQTINVYVRTSKFGNSSFELEYAIVEQESKALAAIGRGTIVYINRDNGKSVKFPEYIKNIILQYEQEQ